MSRHTDTIELRAHKVVGAPTLGGFNSDVARNILFGKADCQLSKWFTVDAIKDYQKAFREQVYDITKMFYNDPHSRSIIMYGPPKACWISTQWLSVDDTLSKYEVVCFYRSLDKAHANIDHALQLAISHSVMPLYRHIESITVVAGSYHEYKENK